MDDFLGLFEEGSESERVPCFFAEVMEDCVDFVSIDSGVFEWKDTLRDEVLAYLGPRLKIEFIVTLPGWQGGTSFVVEVKQSMDVVTSSGSNNVQDVLLGVTDIILSVVVPEVALVLVDLRIVCLLRLHGCGGIEDIKAVTRLALYNS